MTITKQTLKEWAEHECVGSSDEHQWIKDECLHARREHAERRDLARMVLARDKALEVVPHLRILAGAIVEDHQERSHNTETCVSIGGACNARTVLGE